MRLRWQRRVRKKLKHSQRSSTSRPWTWTTARRYFYSPTLLKDVITLERQGLSLVEALHTILIRPGLGHSDEGYAGWLLSIAGDSRAVDALLDRFFTISEENDPYVTALRLETLNDKRAVPPLIKALLEDENPHRRHAAARALGWIYKSGRKARLALARCVADPSQPLNAREEAAESLSNVGSWETVDALISVLGDPEVRLRFWAVFGLGNCTQDPQAFRALESMLDDPEVPPGNWWSVGKEALGMLDTTDAYRGRCKAEAARILEDPNATPEDRRWAEFYGK